MAGKSTISYGIKVSYPGFDVVDLSKDRNQSLNRNGKLSHLLSALAWPYLLGAKTQVQRYQEAALQLPAKQVAAAMRCLHEASALFEDLNTVAKYIKRCGYFHKQDRLWLDIRNHIRHDVREEFDKEDHKSKKTRSQRLNINPKLQVYMGFSNDAIKIGETVVQIIDVEKYLKWAEGVFNTILSQAKEEGFIK